MCYHQRGDKTSGFYSIKAVISSLRADYAPQEQATICLLRQEVEDAPLPLYGPGRRGLIHNKCRANGAGLQGSEGAVWSDVAAARLYVSGRFRHLQATHNLVLRLITGLDYNWFKGKDEDNYFAGINTSVLFLSSS